jgi:hypothetical protein
MPSVYALPLTWETKFHTHTEQLVEIWFGIFPPVALYGCETWSLTLREEHRLRVSCCIIFIKIIQDSRQHNTIKNNFIVVNLTGFNYNQLSSDVMLKTHKHTT